VKKEKQRIDAYSTAFLVSEEILCGVQKVRLKWDTGSTIEQVSGRAQYPDRPCRIVKSSDEDQGRGDRRGAKRLIGGAMGS
jgi:hypothetical protein